MKWIEGRRGEIGAVIAVLMVVLLVGCSTPERSAKMTAIRNHYGHVSLPSAGTSGPAVGRGGGGAGAHGDWMSGETRGQLDIIELAEEGALPIYGPGTTMTEKDIPGMPDIPEAEAIGPEGLEPAPVSGDLVGTEERPRPGEEDPILAAAAELKTIYFDFDEADIREDQMDIVRTNVKWLRDHPSVAVNLEGHCDERGTEEYNMALSEKRATSVREAMISMGIQPHRLSAVPYGESLPVDPTHAEEAWARNRRVEFAPTAVQLLSMEFGD